jgi:agmatinase
MKSSARTTFAWANTEKFEEADIVLFGVPDESHTHAHRYGTAKAPDHVRKISVERGVFERGGARTVSLPTMAPLEQKIVDVGNIPRGQVSEFVEKITRKAKVPFMIGGDHSITAEALKGFDKLGSKIGVVYFDSHPDFICSSRDYYGSVVCDISEYRNIDFSTSLEIGVRDPEPEELLNLRRTHLQTINPIDLAEMGLRRTLDLIKDRVGDRIYLSFDMDVVDPAFAPGVSTPVPGGLSSSEALYLVREVSKLGLVGFDLMEVSPPYDVQDMTSHLAGRIILEAATGVKPKAKPALKAT